MTAIPPVRSLPRISANDLALYMVSKDTARMGIVRRAKNPQTPPIIRYKDARQALCNYLTDPIRKLDHLTTAEAMLRQRAEDPSESSLRQDDARHSIEVLHAVQRMANNLAQFSFHRAPQSQAKLMLAGVEVSVRADLLVYGSTRGQEKIGAAVLRMTQDDADTDAAKEKRREMGLYVATLAKFHVDLNLSSDRTPDNRLCMAIDVQHGEVFQAPASNTRRANDLENACRFIAAMWDTV